MIFISILQLIQYGNMEIMIHKRAAEELKEEKDKVLFNNDCNI